jgi:hypothetical protein
MEVDRVALAEDHVSYRTQDNYEKINTQLLHLQPANDDQRDLRARMLDDWDSVSEFHQRLRTTAHYEVPGFLWVVMITGFLVVMFPCYVCAPKITNLITISMFAAFNGIVMYVNFSIADPFTGPAAIDSFILE